jgi:hypothetical protein
MSFGQNTTAQTGSVWPFKVARQSPVATSHKRTVLSQLPLARIARDGENATLQTWFVWPERAAIGFALARFQRRIFPSWSLEANSTLVAIKSSVDDIAATRIARTETFKKGVQR